MSGHWIHYTIQVEPGSPEFRTRAEYHCDCGYAFEPEVGDIVCPSCRVYIDD